MNTSNNNQLPSYQRARMDVSVAHLGSVSVYEVVKNEPRLREYMEEYHMDEELELHLLAKAVEAALTPKPDKPAY